tara:strand:+ start:54 stop:323 length:270 start_codon:yes stop_codon:yes gene_type:complete
MYILTLQIDSTGVFSLLDEAGEQIIPVFEQEDDAKRYFYMLADQSESDIPLNIVEIEKNTFVDACTDREQKYAIITPDDLLIPPDNVVL